VSCSDPSYSFLTSINSGIKQWSKPVVVQAVFLSQVGDGEVIGDVWESVCYLEIIPGDIGIVSNWNDV
jgi:hypothetical protein